ncbi:TolC family outer membrane protein [Guyparkeria hydrothermalis]|uniref:TolC family outer membrane protein n=1 Tax=Guyparkeria hydrothermalis TaxID=923 RepID=UPI00202197CB|nr:TolC family outer membrane protein [Guyparkeria hydrothermalis]MCL7744775.1 TolC family outer membrane protein [Guyparkeria hydrothermalis]
MPVPRLTSSPGRGVPRSLDRPFRRAALSAAIGMGLTLAAGTAAAADLLDVYALAEQNDQQLRAAQQQRLSVEQNIPIERADLLPQVQGNAGVNYTHTRVLDGGFAGSDEISGTGRNVALTLSQTIYNRTENLQLDVAELQVRQADIDYEQARQDLILRTGQAYFQVLNADAQLQLAKANRTALKRQLERAQRQYDVGLVAVTDVADAQSQYDQANAQIIAARNALNNADAALQTIIGQSENDLDDIRTNLDVAAPQPADPQQWIDLALAQNLELQSAVVGTQIAQQNVDVARSQRAPTVSLEGSYGYDNSPSQFTGRSETLNGQVGVQLNLPIYTGGRINAQSRQAAFDYQRSQFDLEAQRRQVRQQTSDSFRGVQTSISEITAFRQAVESARTSLVATEAGYGVGTRTIVDVLNAELRVFQAMADYLDARYNYITNLLQLKADTGQLTVADLEAINRQLTEQETNALIAPLMSSSKGEGASSVETEMMQRVLERARQTVDGEQ